MAAEKKKKGNRALKWVIAVIAVIVVIVILALVYRTFREKPVEGSKTITISVIGADGGSTDYTVHTDAEYLRQAMEETDGLTFEGTQSEYGMYVETVNGDTADYDTDGAYWSFYVNGDYCNYGIDTQPVEDGDAFTIQYEVWSME